MPCGFVMKDTQPKNDKNTDSRIAYAWIFGKIDGDRGWDKKREQAYGRISEDPIKPNANTGNNQQRASDSAFQYFHAKLWPHLLLNIFFAKNLGREDFNFCLRVFPGIPGQTSLLSAKLIQELLF